jgi:hypothetical protein
MEMYRSKISSYDTANRERAFDYEKVVLKYGGVLVLYTKGVRHVVSLLLPCGTLEPEQSNGHREGDYHARGESDQHDESPFCKRRNTV